MARLVMLQATYRIVTPMFLGGANPNDCAELRPASIKGALRFWYRAIDPDYNKNGNEARIFGGTDKEEGQAMFLLRVEWDQKPNWQWSKERYQALGEKHSAFTKRPSTSSGDQRTWTVNGIQYLGYSLGGLGTNNRQAIPAAQSIVLHLLFRKPPIPPDRKRILAALWLMGHLGGLGSRSRRGFGTLALQDWSVEGDTWPEINRLTIAHRASNLTEWKSFFQQARDTLKGEDGWFRLPSMIDHSVLSGNTHLHLFAKGHKDNDNGVFHGWELALNEAGKVMQIFRQRWDLNDPSSDYHAVKAHICDRDSEASSVGSTLSQPIRPFQLDKAPARAAFGLPLSFRYSSLAYTRTRRDGKVIQDRHGHPRLFPPEMQMGGKEHDRSASPIHIRILQIGDAYHPLYIRLEAPLLAPNEKIKVVVGRKEDILEPPSGTILDDYWKELPNGEGMKW